MLEDDSPDVEVVYVSEDGLKGECFKPEDHTPVVTLGVKNKKIKFKLRNTTEHDLHFIYTVRDVFDAEGKKLVPIPPIKPFDLPIEVKKGKTEPIRVKQGTNIPKGSYAEGELIPNNACAHKFLGHTDWHIDC
jgi:hypothetical protein